MVKLRWVSLVMLVCLMEAGAALAREKVIVDTDVGDDIDDAFSLALAATSPDVDLLGVTTAWGDTGLRARLADRLICVAGREDVPVAAGERTADSTPFTQARWAERAPARDYPNAIDFLAAQIRRYPGQITLVEIAPETNLGALIARDPTLIRALKRVVVMGGSIDRGYNDFGYTPQHRPDAEYNIVSDIPAARAVLGSGVPVVVMPLDSTQIKFDEVRRSLLFADGTPLSDALTLLYHQWRQNNAWGQDTPTLFDVVPMAYVIAPELCPTTRMRIEVNDKGYTRQVTGVANADVCLNSESDKIITLLMTRLLAAPAHTECLN